MGPDYSSADHTRVDEYFGVNWSALFDTIWRRKWLIVIVTIAVMLLSMLVATLTPPNYVASTRILIDPRGLQITDRELTPSAGSGDAGAAIVESQMQVIISDNVLKKVVESERLGQDVDFGAIGAATGLFSAIFGIENKSFSEPKTKALRKLRDSVDVTRTPGSFVVDVTMSSTNAEKSAKIAQSIAETYVSSEIEQRSQLARQTSGILFGRLEELQKKVSESEGKVERYRRLNNLADIQGQPIDEQQLLQLTEELTRVRSIESLANSRYEQIRSVVKAGGDLQSVAGALNSSMLNSLNLRLSSVRANMKSLRAIYGDRHPTLILAREEANSISRNIETELQRMTLSARQEAERARQEVQRFERAIEALKGQSLDIKQSLVELRELEREAKANRSVYETYLLRAREIDEQEGINTVSARIISPAIPPAKPAGLPKSVLLILSAGVGMTIGLALAVVLGAFEKRPEEELQASQFQVPEAANNQYYARPAMPEPATANSAYRPIADHLPRQNYYG